MIAEYRKALFAVMLAATLMVASSNLPAPSHASALQAVNYRVHLPAVMRPVPPPTPTPPPLTPTPPAALSPEQVMLQEINATRGSFGLGALAPVSNLDAAADRHSVDMATHCFTSHTGSDSSTPPIRITEAGYTWSTYGEAVGAATVYDIGMMINAWLNSPPHRALILTTTMRDIGVGYSAGECRDPDNGSVAVWHRWSIDMGVPR